MPELVYDVVFKCFGIYFLFLTIFGTIFDILCAYICHKIKNNSTFSFYKYGNLVSIFGLFYWNFGYFNAAFGPYPDLFQIAWLCRLGNFVQYVSIQFSAWIHVFISLDRYFQIRVKNWKRSYFNGNKPFYATLSLLLLLMALNMNVLIMYGYSDLDANGTSVNYCYAVDTIPSTQWMKLWSIVNSIMYAYLPFAVLTITTIMLLNLLKERQKRVRVAFVNFQEKLNMERIKKLIAGAVVWCVMVSFPSATTRLFYSSLITSDSGQLVLRITDCWILTLHSMNFFLLFKSNKLFESEAKKAFAVVISPKS